MALFKKNQEVQKKKSEVAQITDNFSAIFNESSAHKEIICNAIRDLISANSDIDNQIDTINMLMEGLADLKIEYQSLKEDNKELLKRLMPIMKDEI